MPVTNCIFLPLLDCISWFPVRRIIDLIAWLELISELTVHADYHLFWLDFGNYRRKASPGKLQHEFVKVKLLIFSETFRQKQFYGSFCCFYRFCCFLAVLLSYYSRRLGKVEIFRIFRDKLWPVGSFSAVTSVNVGQFVPIDLCRVPKSAENNSLKMRCNQSGFLRFAQGPISDFLNFFHFFERD